MKIYKPSDISFRQWKIKCRGYSMCPKPFCEISLICSQPENSLDVSYFNEMQFGRILGLGDQEAKQFGMKRGLF